MNVIDPGHRYALRVYDGEGRQGLVFMKREGEGYPFNVGHHPGTNCQEVLRALLDRVAYLQRQIPCVENQLIAASLRTALHLFEVRAARRHGHELDPRHECIEAVPTCPQCGHVDCDRHTELPSAQEGRE